MKKSTVWILVIVILVLLGVAWYAYDESGSASAPQAGTTATSTVATSNAVNYFCASGTINAVYATGTVSLSLSDGRTMTLPQSESGSGIRYETGSGTSQDVVFSSEGNNATLMENNKTTYDSCVAGNEVSSTSGMVTYTDASSLFSFTYPTQFTLSGGQEGFTQAWRSEATSSGLELAVVTIPSSFQPKTNFGGATFTVGTSADPGAVAGCLTDTAGEPAKTSTTTINGIQFTEIAFEDVGAGNIYNVTSYRTVQDNQCYAVEYVIHSAQLANYPPSAGISAFNSSTVQSVLEGITRSFRFLQ